MFTTQELNSIRTIKIDWNLASSSGVIVELKIGRWRARSKLALFDLGLPDAAQSELVSIGSRLLCPPALLKQLAATESKGRENLSKHSFKTAFGLFVPETAYRSFATCNELIAEEYRNTAASIYRNLDTITEEMIRLYDPLRLESFQRLTRNGVPWQIEAHRQAWEQRIRLSIPSSVEIEASYHWQTDLSVIMVPEQRDIYAGNAALPDLQRDLSASVRRHQDDLATFLNTVKLQINALITETCNQVGESIKSKGSLHPRSVVQLKNLLSQIEKLNFWEDEQIAAITRSIAEQLSPTTQRNPAAISELLEAIRTASQQEIADAAAALPQRQRAELEIDLSEPEPASLLRSRILLKLEEPPGDPDLLINRLRPNTW